MTCWGFTLWIAGTPAVTRALTVQYLQPVPLHQPHRITAHITAREGGRALHVAAAGGVEEGVTRFTANAVFVVVDTAHFFAAHGDISGFGERLEQFSRRGGGLDGGQAS